MSQRPRWVQQHGLHDTERAASCEQLLRAVHTQGIQQLRVAWCDMHGILRSKSLTPQALEAALMDGVGMVSTLMLKDTSDRTVIKVFEPGALDHLEGFGQANNVLLIPDPDSLMPLPWAPHTAWLRAQPWFDSGAPVTLDTRRMLQSALHTLAQTGHGLRCGLELEFHVYKVQAETLDPNSAAWPGAAPTLGLVHPGYQLLSDDHADATHHVLDVVRRTAQGMMLPLLSLEIELGPSQFEAVFAAQDALVAADSMVMFRHAVRQALRREGYLATFMCLPPFEHVMASGWHLHHSLVNLQTGANVFMREQASNVARDEAEHVLSAPGSWWLAGLLRHAAALALPCVPTANGYARFRPNALAPHAAVWGHDNRGAMVRVIGKAQDPATRIENRLGEPAANPYLAMAAHIHAGISGMTQKLTPPRATLAPYDAAGRAHAPLPNTMGIAIDALANDAVLCEGLGEAFCRLFTTAKRHELQRLADASDAQDWMRREYLARM